MPTVRSRAAAARVWAEGPVDRKQEHFTICYGEGSIPVALVARENRFTFKVEFLLGRRTRPQMATRITDAVRQELDQYLLHSVSPDSWAFARYHCDTVANIASPVHWSWQPSAA
jgi:hypothetical protein